MINAYPQPTNTAPTFPPAESPSATPQTPQKKGLFSSFTKKTWYLIGGLVALIVLVAGSGAGLYLAQNQGAGEIRNQASTGGESCAWCAGADQCPNAPTAVNTALCSNGFCCQGYNPGTTGNTGNTGGTGGTTATDRCDESQTTARACRGAKVGDHVGGTCTCFRTTGTLCGCRADTAPTNPPTTGGSTGGTGGTVDKGDLGGTKTANCSAFGGTCKRSNCLASDTLVSNGICSGREDVCCKPSTGTASRTCDNAGGTPITQGAYTGRCLCPDGSNVAQSGNCNAGSTCTDGAKRCQGNSAQLCRNGNWIENQECTSGCSNGVCTGAATGGSVTVGSSCTTVNTFKCLANTSLRCGSSLKYEFSETCDADEDCSVSIGKCVRRAGAARTCSIAGTAPTTALPCCEGLVRNVSGICSNPASPTCGNLGGTCQRSSCSATQTQIGSGTCSNREDFCCSAPRTAQTCQNIGATDAPAPNIGKCRCPNGTIVTQQGTCNTIGGSTGGTGTGTGTGGTGTGGTGTGGTSTGGSCVTGGNSCETGSCCGGLVCQGAAGARKCQQQDNTVCKDGGTCTGYIGFKCSSLSPSSTSNGVPVCESNPSAVTTSRATAVAYAGTCGQMDQVCQGGSNPGTLCGEFTIFNSSCGGQPPASTPPKPPVYECNSLCTTNAQCRGENDQLRCVTVANGSKRCRLNGNEASTKCQPAVGPQCLAIRLRKADGITPIKFGENDPKLGESVTLLCGKVDAAARYIFRVVDPDGDRTRLESTGQVSAPFKIEKAGKYTAQCQICTGDSNDTCLPFESLND